jgi:hypothetical protein
VIEGDSFDALRYLQIAYKAESSVYTSIRRIIQETSVLSVWYGRQPHYVAQASPYSQQPPIRNRNE